MHTSVCRIIGEFLRIREKTYKTPSGYVTIGGVFEGTYVSRSVKFNASATSSARI